MIKELNLVNSDLILNSTRILILISKFESQKSFKLSANKIMLYDFYMKFPQTMVPKEYNVFTLKDFNEFYSFFHVQPDREEYQLYIRYLISKNLVKRTIKNNDFNYQINTRGKEFIVQLESQYSLELNKVADYVKEIVSKLSDSKIEENISLVTSKIRNDHKND